MAFALMDDQIQGHPKFARAGLDAIGLWTLCLSHCSAFLTDGYIARATAERYAGARLDELAEKLVACGDPGRAGLWDVAEGGWRMHDYLDWNPSASKVKSKRKKERDRKEKGRKTQGRDAGGRVTSARNPSGHPAESEAPPAHVREESSAGHTGSHAHAHSQSEEKHTRAPARVGERVASVALMAAWNAAGLGPMQDSTAMAELRAAFNRPECDADPVAYCAAWKRLSTAWRRGGAKGSGESPRLMVTHMDKVHLVVTGELNPEELSERGKAPATRRFNDGIGAQPVTKEE